MLIIISVIIILSILFFIFYNYFYLIENQCNKDSHLLEYKISKHNIKTNNIKNKFNIKEFDSINDNIIVHNKFKNELLEYKAKKKILLEEIDKSNKQKTKKYKDNLNKNIEIEKEKNLSQDITILKSDIKSLSSLLKSDLNNILNDIKQNKLSKIDKIKLKSIVSNELKKNKYLFNSINNNTNNEKIIELNKLYKQLLQKKIDILNKKYKIYVKILN